MLALQRKASNVVTWTAKQLIENLQRVTDILCNLESLSMMTFAKLLGPRFKCLGFLSSSVKRLKSECAAKIRNPEPTPSAAFETRHTTNLHHLVQAFNVH